MMGIFKLMMEQQQQQNAQQQEQIALLREGLLAAQQTAAAVVNRVAAPREPRPGNLSDFMKLSPAVFTGTEEPLAAERWITDMANLLEGANIPAADQVKMVKLRLTDIARSWWLAD